MKTILLTAAIGVAFALGTTLEANATITYTDETDFLTKIAPGYYHNDFSGIQLSPSVLTSPQDFTQSGYSYSISAVNGLFGLAGAISVNYEYDSIVVDFKSGNVTAVGGTAFLTDFSGNLFTGTVTVTLGDGTKVTTDTENFFGFTSAGAVIDSLTIRSSLPDDPLNPSSFASLDNFYVGTAVAEPSTLTAGLLLSLLIGFHWALRERKQAKNS